MSDVMKRHEKVAFYGVPTGVDGGFTFHRMKGFNTLSVSKNAKEYTRQYIDEAFEQTDVVGYSPSMSFGFDRMPGNAAHDDIVAIFDGEKLGSEAARPIVIVDMTSKEKTAQKRDFSIIADSEGDSTDAYTYSGTFKANSETVNGTATSNDNWETLTFAEQD